MRELVPIATGSNRFDAVWFERARRWPEVAFVIPAIRSAAALVDLFSETANAPVTVDLRATAEGDPLLAGLSPPGGSALVLSAEAAQRLDGRKGQALTIPLSREREGRAERVAIEASVADVLPLSSSEGASALASPSLLEAIESWRDGYLVAGFGAEGSGPPPPRSAYPTFRMYAGSIREVDALAQRLEAEGVSMRTRAREIAATLGLQRNLRTVLALVGTITIAGAAVALAALQIATVRRKRREYALLKLTGHGRSWLVALPCAHAVAVALAGGIFALAVYFVAAAAINTYFAAHLSVGERAVRLGTIDIVAGLIAALVVSVVPALWGGWRASNVEAADELREH
jgi:putative ABC transport system permease protein